MLYKSAIEREGDRRAFGNERKGMGRINERTRKKKQEETRHGRAKRLKAESTWYKEIKRKP